MHRSIQRRTISYSCKQPRSRAACAQETPSHARMPPACTVAASSEGRPPVWHLGEVPVAGQGVCVIRLLTHTHTHTHSDMASAGGCLPASTHTQNDNAFLRCLHTHKKKQSFWKVLCGSAGFSHTPRAAPPLMPTNPQAALYQRITQTPSTQAQRSSQGSVVNTTANHRVGSLKASGALTVPWRTGSADGRAAAGSRSARPV